MVYLNQQTCNTKLGLKSIYVADGSIVVSSGHVVKLDDLRSLEKRFES